MLSGVALKGRGYKSAAVSKIPEENFPPCIKKMLEGLVDGRKRAIFVLINFLHTVGYGWDEIDAKLNEWNSRNPEQISESYLKGQLEYAKKQNRQILPPNCSNAGYYKDIKVCIPDNYCSTVRNPAGYAAKKSAFSANKNSKKPAKRRNRAI